MTSKKVPKSSNDKFCKIYDDICSTNNNNQCIEPVTEIQNTSIEVTMTTKKVPKSSNLFFCEKCNFTCSRESQYKRHLSTSKHQNTSNTSISIQKSAVFKCECGNHYKHRQSLYNHKNKCNFLLESKNHSSEPSPPQQSANSNTDNSELVEKMFTMFTQMMTHNQDFMQNVIGKVQGINTNSHNNSHNNTHFNINMFLNDHCKNAMNISDFIKSLPITAQHYENTKDNGLTDTLTNLMVDGLNNMEVVERPIHCTDKKRKVMYVKDDDKWDKDDDNNLILKNLKDLSVLHGQNLKLWQEKNPKYEKVEKLQIELTNIISELYTNILEERKPINKFINTLTNSTYLNDDMKEQYKKNDSLSPTL